MEEKLVWTGGKKVTGQATVLAHWAQKVGGATARPVQ